MKKPWLAFLLSFILPGLGHLYLGLFPKGILLIILALTASLLNEFVNELFMFLFLIVWIYGLVSSIRQTKILNREKFS